MKRTVELHPGVALGPFRLGATLIELGAILRDEKTYGIVRVEGDVIENPSTADMILKCDDWATELVVDAASQCLKAIRHTCSTNVCVIYQGRTMVGPSISPTYAFVSEVLGPTIPWRLDGEDGVMLYPGLTVRFQFRDISSVEADGPFPTKRSDGSLVTATFLDLSLDPSCVGPRRGVAQVKVGLGVEWDGKAAVTFASTTQDVISALGPPTRALSRRSDPASIHRRRPIPRARTVLTYPDWGVDVVISDVTQRVTTVVLHNAFPSGTTFLSYLRCDFVCPLPSPPFAAGAVLKNETKWSTVTKGVPLPIPLTYTPRFISTPVTIVGCEGLVVMISSRDVVESVTIFDEAAAEEVAALGRVVYIPPPLTNSGAAPLLAAGPALVAAEHLVLRESSDEFVATSHEHAQETQAVVHTVAPFTSASYESFAEVDVDGPPMRQETGTCVVDEDVVDRSEEPSPAVNADALTFNPAVDDSSVSVLVGRSSPRQEADEESHSMVWRTPSRSPGTGDSSEATSTPQRREGSQAPKGKRRKSGKK